MRVVTWNVNSIRARLPRVLELLEVHAPHVVCVQETKSEAAAFPHEALEAAGYHAVEHSQGRWNGVALLARSGLRFDEISAGLPGEPEPAEARWLEATVEGVRFVSVYVPNGRDPDHPMFAQKLGFLDAMRSHLAVLVGAGPLVVAGDFNVAPEDRDVWDPAAFAGATHVTEDERRRMEAIVGLGFVDAFRSVATDEAGFTWWDYRMGAFRRGMGMRIDLALVADVDVAAAEVDTAFRRDNAAGDKPSDHAPLLVELAT